MPRNEASAADTVIAPAEPDDSTSDKAADAAMIKALGAVGQNQISHVGIIDSTIDADGCMTAPLAASHLDGTSIALDAVAQALRKRGVVVTVISGKAVQAIDAADQGRIRAIKGSFNLVLGQDGGRWFATKADMIACTRIDDDDGKQEHVPHAPLAAMLLALHQNLILAIGDSQAESRGARWNIIEGELSGNSVDGGESSASLSATLVLKNGATLWTGSANARGSLRPPLDRQAVELLQGTMMAAMAKMKVFKDAHPDDTEPPDAMDKQFNAVAGGDLDGSPLGATMGPSTVATMQAAADRLINQLQPILPGTCLSQPATQCGSL